MRTAVSSYGQQSISEEDIAAVVDLLRSDFLTGGPVGHKFEQALASRVAAPETIACNSGTSGLHVALAALDIGPTDTVFVPAISFVATANSGRYLRAKIQFVDVSPQTGLMTPETLIDAINTWRADGADGPVGAVIPVHFAGQSVDLPNIRKISLREGGKLVVDACHALNSKYEDETGKFVRVGSAQHADAEVFSFHAVKTICTGEGGAVTTRDHDLAERVRSLCSHGIARDPLLFQSPNESEQPLPEAGPWYYEMLELGHNFRMADLNAALGLSQLSRLTQFTEKRRQLVDLYHDQLVELAPLVRPMPRLPASDPSWHLMIIHIDFAEIGRSRTEIMGALKQAGIGTQVHYIPIYKHPYYRKLYAAETGRTTPFSLPGAETYYSSALTLPLHVNMTNDDVTEVVRALKTALESSRV